MHDAAHIGEAAIQFRMRRRVGRRVQRALDLFAFQVDHDHILRAQLLIRHAGRLDDEQTLLAIDAGDVAPRKHNQPVLGQEHIGFINLLLQGFKHFFSFLPLFLLNGNSIA